MHTSHYTEVNSLTDAMPLRLTVFLPDDFVKRLDTWRRAQENPPTRGLALRALAEEAMDARGVVAQPPPPLPAPPKRKVRRDV